MYRRNNSQAYASLGLETSVNSASPHQLIMLLFDGALNALKLAELHMDEKNIAGKGAAISKAINIIETGLRGSLNFDIDGDLAYNLDRLYGYISQQLLYANLNDDRTELARCHELMSGLADAWRQIGQSNMQSTQE